MGENLVFILFKTKIRVPSWFCKAGSYDDTVFRCLMLPRYWLCEGYILTIVCYFHFLSLDEHRSCHRYRQRKGTTLSQYRVSHTKKQRKFLYKTLGQRYQEYVKLNFFKFEIQKRCSKGKFLGCLNQTAVIMISHTHNKVNVKARKTQFISECGPCPQRTKAHLVLLHYVN